MKGYRFYEEFDSSYKKRKHLGSGNVLALDIDPKTGHPYGWVDHNHRYVMECTAAVFSHADSGVAGAFLNVSHAPSTPTMFAFLDSFTDEVSA